MITSDILLFIVFSVASVGVGNLYLFLIRDGQLLGFMQHVIEEYKANQFIYKSIGGCNVCTRQRFVEIVYVVFLFTCECQVYWWSAIIGYILFSGVAFYMDMLTKQNAVDVKKENLSI